MFPGIVTGITKPDEAPRINIAFDDGGESTEYSQNVELDGPLIQAPLSQPRLSLIDGLDNDSEDLDGPPALVPELIDAENKVTSFKFQIHFNNQKNLLIFVILIYFFFCIKAPNRLLPSTDHSFRKSFAVLQAQVCLF